MIRALPATFSGTLFRSRTEARWAVFMTELGIEWHYEHEAFALPSGNYLPDFWLPNMRTFIEIKGEEPPGCERRLYGELAESTSCTVILLIGTPAEYLSFVRDYYEKFPQPCRCHMIGGTEVGDSPYFWTVCDSCSAVGIEFDGRSARVTHNSGCPVIGTYQDKNYNHDNPKILSAIQRSKEWRSPEGG